eukprot:m.36794 g.36794  ORF g.36794 m.36794 type:complete len:131 (-) comp44834_c0_seq1:1102-1494(-)
MRTPLHHAAMKNSVACIAALLQAGANHEARDKYGYTPLDLTRIYWRSEAAEYLSSARPPQANIKPAISRQPFDDEESQSASPFLSTDRVVNLIALDFEAFFVCTKQVEYVRGELTMFLSSQIVLDLDSVA